MLQPGRAKLAILLVTIISVIPTANAQSSLAPNQLLGLQSPTRDPQAVEIVQTAIAAMGGQGDWAAVTKAKSTWTIADPNLPGVTSVGAWDDDWSSGFMVFNHKITSASGTHIISASGNHVVQDQEPSGTTALPQKLQDIALPWCFPAAALQLELNNPSYKLEYLGLDNSSALVRITRINHDGFADLYSIQVWKIDLKTGFAASVHFYTEDLTNNVPYPQSLRYSSYKQLDGVQVPTVLLFNETAHPSSLTLKSFSLN